MITEKYFNSIEKIILIILLIATVSAIAQEIIQVIELGEVYLADILLLFIFLEVIGMIKEYYLQNKIAISHPIFIAITALARLIILQRKDFNPEVLIYEASAILILSLSILALRARKISFFRTN
ncbi:MAG: phosphate-starvation-inducible PsiE family protein [Gammaproteobacteria bacterium]|jgi:protein PsiE|nr:phosphate-starvation-inducible PsiE family protein [Gammaproteobacteria bacterium]MBT7602933.1 phosphate-starvation-inducible PsiE family protein [Gammaproteobacteria bacterium]